MLACPDALKVKSIWPRFMLDATAQSNELVNLLPTHTSSWWPMVEDVVGSPAAVGLLDGLVHTALRHQEAMYLSIDGTFRVCLPLLGQAPFTAPKAVRDKQPFGDDRSYHRVLSVRGRTGAVLALTPSKGEGSEDICQCLLQSLPPDALQQVIHVASDSPSGKLFSELRKILPHMEGLSLDPTHAAMHYEQATGGRRTHGSSLLRRFLSKFSCHGAATSHNVWGLMYDGTQSRCLTTQEMQLRDHVMEGTMNARRARRVISESEMLETWPTRIQFVEAVAALAADNKKDLSRKIDGTKLTVAKILYNLVAADRLEWLFNNLRFRVGLNDVTKLLLPSGTASNEALHAELNAIFRQTQQLHRSTLELKLQVIRLAKLLAHGGALYSPTARQITSGHVLARRLGQPLWSTAAWKAWVEQQRADQTYQRKSLPLAAQRMEEQAIIATSKGRTRPAKKPAARRTPFTLQREAGIQRTGVCKRQRRGS